MQRHFLSLMDEAILFGDMEPIPQDDPQEYAEAIAGIQRGLDDFAKGRHKPVPQAFAEMKALPNPQGSGFADKTPFGATDNTWQALFFSPEGGFVRKAGRFSGRKTGH